MGTWKVLFKVVRVSAILTAVLLVMSAYNYEPEASPNFEILDVSYGTQVTIYERTSALLIETFSIGTLMGPGGTFFTPALEYYTITSDGKYVTIHCHRDFIDGGGHNIEAVSLEGIPGFPGGLWASVIINYTLGVGGDKSMLVNALGSDYNGTYTYVGDGDTELVLGFEVDMGPPFLYIESSTNKNDIKLRWEQPLIPAISHFLIYRSESQTEFDFSTVWKNTSTDINPITGVIDPLNPEWLDTNVTNIIHQYYRDEYYYIVRAVNAPGMKSSTSNTVGYYVVQFKKGLNTFSLPLQPQDNLSLETVMNDLNATMISELDSNDEWLVYTQDPLPNATLGKGYVAELPANMSYPFTGEPASMIIYKEGFGFDQNERKDINASIDANDYITVSWTPIIGADKYFVYCSDSRHGFFTQNYGIAEVMQSKFMEPMPISSIKKVYYLVVPYNATTKVNGSSTYSIGILNAEWKGNEFFGLPLKPVWSAKSADWYSDQIPYCLGMVYLEDGLWKTHFKEFDEGVYDTTVKYGKGYELSVYMPSQYAFIGW